MNSAQFTNLTVKATIKLLTTGRFAWFAADVNLYDDGIEKDFVKWSHNAFQHREQFRRIDRVDENRLADRGRTPLINGSISALFLHSCRRKPVTYFDLMQAR